MDKFVSAVKGWVKFELILTGCGLISIVIGIDRAYQGIPSEYTSDEFMLIYYISFIVLSTRLYFLYSILKSDKPAKLPVV